MSAPQSRRLPLVTGLDYHVLEWGADADHDHTVVLVHGFLDLSWGWLPMVRDAGLDEAFHIIAPDMRGHGDSDRAGAGGYYHFMDYLADLDDLIRQLGRDRVSLVGHSMGGSIASYYAGTYPERIHRLAILEGLGPPELESAAPDRVRRWIAMWRDIRSGAGTSYANREEAAARLRKRDPLLSAEMVDWLVEVGTRATDDGRVVFKHDPLHLSMGPYPFRVEMAAEFWQRITAPVLFVDGSESAFRHHSDEMERRLGFFADVRSRTIAGAGHMMTRHTPRELGDILREFLA